MDWPCYDMPYLGFGKPFKTGQTSPNPCRILTQFGTNEFQQQDLSNQEDWSQMFSGILSINPDGRIANALNGFCVILCSRAYERRTEVPADIFHLPIPETSWQKITKAFHLHEDIKTAIIARETYSYIATHDARNDANVNDMLYMYTSVMGDVTLNNIGISVTHFRGRKLTLAVLYGCSAEQIDKATRLLHQCGTRQEAKKHPLLVIGTYSELQCQALKANLEHLMSDWESFHAQWLNLKYDDPKVQELIAELRGLHKGMNRANSEIRITQRYLKRVIPQIRAIAADLENGSQDMTKCLLQRFEELDGIYDDMIVKYEKGFSDLEYDGSFFMAELSRIEAKSANQKAKMSTILALVATLYLPAATIAAIFSMPVFDFQNKWLTLNWQPVASNQSQTESSQDPQESVDINQPVVSAYFWVYLVISGTLTFITLCWWWRSRMLGDDESLPLNSKQVMAEAVNSRTANLTGARATGLKAYVDLLLDYFLKRGKSLIWRKSQASDSR